MNEEKEVYFGQIANRASTTVLKSPKTHAMTVSQNPAIQIPTNQ